MTFLFYFDLVKIALYFVNNFIDIYYFITYVIYVMNLALPLTALIKSIILFL